MPVPQPERQILFRRSKRQVVLLLLVCAAGAFAAWNPAVAKTKQPAPEARLLLDTLGFPGVSPTFLAGGGSMLTVDFADNNHLLVTFSERGLVPRLANDTPGDEDRMVAAKLIELPSGTVVAQTEWRLHDHGRYLWNLGKGRFLLRIQDNLSTFAPAANLAEGIPFQRTAFGHRPGEVAAIVVSSDYELLTVETSPQRPHVDPSLALKAAAAAAYAARPHFTASAFEPPPPPPPVPVYNDTPSGPAAALDFYRLSGSGTPQSPLEAEEVAAIGTTSFVSLPVDSDGYLHAVDSSRGQWSLVFHDFSGKNIPLAPLKSSCAPILQRVSPTQFVSLNCQGALGGLVLVAYDFAKHEIWEDPMDASPVASAFALAPEAGRFAISRVTAFVATDALPGPPVVPDYPGSGDTQTVRVYQTQTGDLLFKMDCNPVFRSAENFDLSADGMQVAVVRNGAIEIYRLPELTKGDSADLADLQAFTPPPAAGPIDLKGLADAAPTVDVAMGQAPVIVNGDAPVRRAPPTLLKPGEKAQFPSSNLPEN